MSFKILQQFWVPEWGVYIKFSRPKETMKNSFCVVIWFEYAVIQISQVVLVAENLLPVQVDLRDTGSTPG